MNGAKDRGETHVLMVAGQASGSTGIGDYADELTAHMSGIHIETIALPDHSDNPIPYLRQALHVGSSKSDVVHIQHEYGMFGSFALMTWVFFPVIYLLCAVRGVSVAVTVHEGLNKNLVTNPLKPVKQIYIEALNRCIALGADHIIFLSENGKEEFTESVNIDTYTVLPHGVNTTQPIEFSQEEAKQRLGYEPTDIIVSEPGYVEPRKGSKTLVGLANRLPEYEFLLAGGPSSDAYTDYFEHIKSRAPENLRVTGRLPEDKFHATFMASDVIILPYRETEQQGVINTLNQSGIFNRCASYGKPVIAADLEHFHMLNEDWDCMWIADFNNSDAAASNIERILHDDTERKRIRENISRYAEANSFVAVAEQHVKLYRQLTDNG